MTIPFTDKIKVLFAVDDSGSTGGENYYWKTVSDIYEEVISEYAEDEIYTLSWGSNAIPITHDELKKYIQQKHGHNGGTYIPPVAQFIKDNKFHGKFVLITDGEVEDVAEGDKIVESHGGFEEVECHIINHGSLNISVTCPFTRGLNSRVYTYDKNEGKKLIINVTQEVKDTFLRIGEMNVDEFEKNYDTIELYLATQNMGRPLNKEYFDKVTETRKRLIFEHNKKEKGEVDDEMLKCIEKKDIKGGVEMIKQMTKEYYNKKNHVDEVEELSFETKLHHLIEICGNAVQNEYDLLHLRRARANRATAVDQSKLDTMEKFDCHSKIFGTEMLMTCDVSEDTPIILLVGDNVFKDLPNVAIDDIKTCPVRLVNYPIIVERMKQSFGGVVTIKEFREKKMTNSPVNNKAICGGIMITTKQELLTNVYGSLARLYSHDKLYGFTFYYMIGLYMVLKELNDYKQIMPALKEFIVDKMKTTYAYAALSGSEEYVTTMIRTDIAFWYVVHSCLVDLPPCNDPFLLHINDINAMVEILELMEYPVDPEVKHRLNLIQSCLLLNKMKQINRDTTNCVVKAMYQKAVYIDKSKVREAVCKKEFYMPFIFVDGEADQEQRDKVLSLIHPYFKTITTKEMFNLNETLSKPKRVTGLIVPRELNSEPQAVSLWNGMETKDKSAVYDEKKMKAAFVKKYGSEPTREEYLLFVWRRLRTETIPSI